VTAPTPEPALSEANVATPAGRGVWRVVQVLLTAIVIVFAGWKLQGQWKDASRADLQVNLHWDWMASASVLVFGTYIVLIETWRRVLSALGAKIGFATAARIWFASNLGKYLPGKIWTVTAMVAMTKEQGISLAVSGASAVVITIASVASGFAVVLFTSMETVQRLTGGTTAVIASTLGMIVCLAAAPILTQQWNRIAERFGRPQLSVDVPLAAIMTALVGCALSWYLYGMAFEWFVRSLLGDTAGTVSAYTAAYGASYLFGYLTLFAPGGIGARELALAAILPSLGLATQAQAAMITVASRLWLTIVELVPSVIAAIKSASRNKSSRA
jgi:hypothetical protein